MPKDIVINEVVCPWVEEYKAWVQPTAIFCYICKDSLWGYAGTTIRRSALIMYETGAYKILHKVSTNTYIAYCGSRECAHNLEIELTCPNI